MTSDQTNAEGGRSPCWQIFLAFLRLGLSSFGGPVAHLGYFRHEFVQRRRWLDEPAYAELLALCQLLPGPASSQLSMALGQLRGGWPGALAAWLGFTLPSALLMLLLALGLSHHPDWLDGGLLHGLKIAAVAVVAQALWGMARTLCPDRPRVALALGAAVAMLLLPSALSQLGVMAVGALLGWRWLRMPAPAGAASLPWAGGLSRRGGLAALALFALLLVGLPLAARWSGSAALGLLDAFYRAGALVFGGGHVVLPLLQAALVPPGYLGNAEFLAGYGAAQALPGPLFSLAAYLGAMLDPAQGGGLGGLAGGLLCLLAVFLPGALLVLGVLPLWQGLRRKAGLQSAMAGVNAAVVGLLLAALYDPVWVGAIGSRGDFALALAGFGLLVWGRVSPLWVVGLSAACGWAMAVLTG